MPISTDPELDRSLREDGYGIGRIATLDELAEIEALYRSLGVQDGENFYLSRWVQDAARRRELHESIRDFIYPKAREIFAGYEPVFGNFIVKHPVPESAIDLHQDWTFIDENEWRSINVWLAITPLTMDCGPLKVVPRSHRFSNIFRGRNIPSPFAPILDEIEREHAQTVIPERGEAIVFDSALLHGSGVNESGKDRIAISLVLKPKPAKLYHCFRPDGEKDVLYRTEVQPDFFTANGLFGEVCVMEGRENVKANPPPFETRVFNSQYAAPLAAGGPARRAGRPHDRE